MSSSHLLFVTGKLAEPSLRRLLAALAPRAGFEYTVAVMPIKVVALATTSWLARHLTVPPGIERVILPGLCRGQLDVFSPDLQVECGPNDLLELPEFFGCPGGRPADYGHWDIAILAELNQAQRLSRDELVSRALKARADGADVIDLGCEPGPPWLDIGDAVKALRDQGLRVSVDTWQVTEAAAAAAAGAELVLSVNACNRNAAGDWGCEVVAVPDQPETLAGLDDTIEFLDQARVPFRLDPVLSPIGFGFAAALGRYLEVRRRYPERPMLMGVGNVTELTDVDSAGINVMLLGFCQEVGIRSVLTTEVINWCRSSVRELDLARRLVYYACQHHLLPKRLEPNLVMLRDPGRRERGREALAELAAALTDNNWRLAAEGGQLFAFNGTCFLESTDPWALFQQMQQAVPIDPAHAFYLGFELAKAVTALTLGKNYVQDQSLRWGLLTRPEKEGP